MPRKPNAPVSRPLFAEPVFAEGIPTPDPSQFTVTPDDSADYTKQVNALLSTEVVSFPQASGKPGDIFSLETAWGPNGPAVIQSINQAQSITFHMVGDSGATAQSTFPAMIKVSDAVTNDFHSASAANRPSFLFHLGDLVYNFGESAYYYDEFYEPYRNYPAPIFAIPGNHDSFVLPNTPKGSEPLTIFQRNFCSASTVVTVEAGSLHRTSMTQPGVYFALDAPYVRIIGLFSNALEDPGVISSQSSTSAAKSSSAPNSKKVGKRKTTNNATVGTPTWPVVPDYQLAFLTAQLQNIKSSNYQGAVILAVHHPPFIYSPPGGGSGGGTHYGSPFMLADIDTVCKNVGVYPHAIISGHAHNYQRYTRKLQFNGKSYSVPFVICGDGGHNVDALVKSSFGKKTPEPGDNLDVSYMDTGTIFQSTGLTLNKHDDQDSGFLRIQATASNLTITFNPVPKSGTASKPDTVTVNLAAHTVA
jgi:Calcineurin-like phosphoesterase